MTLKGEDESRRVGRGRQTAVGTGFAVPIDTASCGQLLLGLGALHWESFARGLWTGLVDV